MFAGLVGTQLVVAATSPSNGSRNRNGGTRHRWLALGVLCTTLLLSTLDNTVLNVALPTLSRTLGASMSELQWIVDAYTVVFAGLLLTAGSLGDRWGRKGLFVCGLAVFGSGSAASAFAPSPDVLIAMRGIMGVGGAMLMPATLSILVNLFPGPRERVKALGIWSGVSGIGIAAGPLLGGWLLAHFWWGSIFLINVPLVVVAIVAAALVVPTSRDPVRRPLDVAGAMLSAGGLLVLVWAIIRAPLAGWGSPSVVGGLVIAGVAIVGFLVHERHCRHPMLDLHLFADRRFSAANAAVAFLMLGLAGVAFLLTQYLQLVLGYGPFATGVRIVPVAVALGVVAPISAALVRRVGTRVLLTGGLVVVAGSLAWLAATTTDSGYTHALIGLIGLGAGVGLAMPVATDSILGSLSPERAGIGAGVDETVIQVGSATGVAVLGSVAAARYSEAVGVALGGHHVPPAAVAIARTSVAGALGLAAHVGGSTGAALASIARNDFLGAMHLALGVGAVVVGAGAVAAASLLPRGSGLAHRRSSAGRGATGAGPSRGSAPGR